MTDKLANHNPELSLAIGILSFLTLWLPLLLYLECSNDKEIRDCGLIVETENSKTVGYRAEFPKSIA